MRPPSLPRPQAEDLVSGRRPSHDAPKIVLAIVAVFIVVFTVVLGLALWVARPVPSLCDGSCPKAIGVAMAESLDRTNWTLTFTSVPSGLDPSATFVTLLAVNGSALLPPTPLTSFAGGVVPLLGSAGGIYVRYHGVTLGSVSAGDIVYLGTTFAGTAILTEGCQVQMWEGGTVMYQGTLQ